MEKLELNKMIEDNLKVGMIFDNPGGGTSEIVSITLDRITYLIKNSKIQIKIDDIVEAYNKFREKEVKTSELKEFKPKVFDSKKSGHSCNCTMLFMILCKLGLTDGEIRGRGVARNPFFIKIK